MRKKRIRFWTPREVISDFSKESLVVILGIIFTILISQFPFFKNAFDYVDLRFKLLDTYYIDRKIVNCTTKEEITKREFIGGFQIYNQGTKNAEEIRGSIKNLPVTSENDPTFESAEECSINSEGPQTDSFITKCKRLSANTSLRIFFLFNKHPNIDLTSISVTSKQGNGKSYQAPHPERWWRVIYWAMFIFMVLLVFIMSIVIILRVLADYTSFV
jgi:hypothetical protein